MPSLVSNFSNRRHHLLTNCRFLAQPATDRAAGNLAIHLLEDDGKVTRWRVVRLSCLKVGKPCRPSPTNRNVDEASASVWTTIIDPAREEAQCLQMIYPPLIKLPFESLDMLQCRIVVVKIDILKDAGETAS